MSPTATIKRPDFSVSPRAEDLIGARLEADQPTRSTRNSTERMRAGIRSGWESSQVERTLQGRHLLMTRIGVIENGMLQSVWTTARDITALKQAEAEVLRLNEELKAMWNSSRRSKRGWSKITRICWTKSAPNTTWARWWAQLPNSVS